MKKGFTLVEVLAVIAILAIIALITVPTVGKTITKQRKKTFEVNVTSLIKVIEADSMELTGEITYTYNGKKLTRSIAVDDSTNVSFTGTIPGVTNATISINDSNQKVLNNMTDGIFTASYNEEGELVISEN